MTALVVTPILQNLYGALAAFIAGVTGLEAGETVVQGLPNRAAMPLPGFIVIQSVTRTRLRTNLHTYGTSGDPTTVAIEEGVQLRVQIDCYGPQSTDAITGAEDWATMLSTTLRDAYGVSILEPSGIVPLHADEARMVPLVDGEDQYEERWMLEAFFQYNPVTTAPQQYADELTMKLWDVPVQAPYGE
jgi:hypothetical protein